MSADATLETRVAAGAQSETPAGLAPVKLGSDLTSRPARSPGQIALGRFRRSRLAMVGLVMFGLLVLAAVFADAIAPYGENEIDLFNITAPPS
ncbi:MAG: N-terminal domain of oligopeptide transport permease, partial [Thermomicrobiales bacterium]|nr:N-terminal domain of oligopeptide transport permease [Thermomicrobiales bacterium]